MTRYRILQVGDNVGEGGPARIMVPLARELARRGHDVRVACLCEPPERVRDDWERGAPRLATYYIPAHRSRGAALGGLRRALADFRPEIVHVHGYLGLIALHWRHAGRRPEPVVIAHMHGYLSHAPWRQKLILGLYRRAMRWSDLIVTVSQNTRAYLEAMGLPPVRLRVVCNAVEPLEAPPDRAAARARWNLPEGVFTVGFLGRLEPLKRVDILLRALARMKAQGRDFRCLIAGAGSTEARVAAEIRQLGLDDRVRLCGWQPDSAGFLAALDALALLSDCEGQPVVILDAMRLGLPVLVNRAGGMPELVTHERTGAIVERLDPALVAEQLEAFARDPDLCARLGAEARRVVAERFGVARMTDEIETVYAEARAGRRGPA